MKYRNKKNKNIYKLIAFGKNTESDEMMAIYTIYEQGSMEIYVRPYDLFVMNFEPVNEV